MIHVVDFFAGCGALSLGIKMALGPSRVRCVGYVERDAAAAASRSDSAPTPEAVREAIRAKLETNARKPAVVLRMACLHEYSIDQAAGLLDAASLPLECACNW